MEKQLTAPFPYFGGKRRAASKIWEALGDVGGYIEPFAGSAAVLLARPEFSGRRTETLNDSDGWLVNTWRAIKHDPAAVAEHAGGPVTEIDFHARLAWLQERRDAELVAWLEGDPEAFDAKAAGWWLYVVACGIGDPWKPGSWRVVDGKLTKAGTPGGGAWVRRGLPHLGSRGIIRQLPHLGTAGAGVHARLGGLVNVMGQLADRLQAVRITCGDWRRVLRPSGLNATSGNSSVGILLDPPYATSGDLYATTNQNDEHETISTQVREWARDNSTGYRVVLCGYLDEHDELLDHGWSVTAGKAGGRGYGAAQSSNRERLWLSPECLGAQQMFDLEIE